MGLARSNFFAVAADSSWLVFRPVRSFYVVDNKNIKNPSRVGETVHGKQK